MLAVADPLPYVLLAVIGLAVVAYVVTAALQDRLEPYRVLWTEFTLRNSFGRRWYNHEDCNVRLAGSSLSWGGVMAVQGFNRIYGDGSGEWVWTNPSVQWQMESASTPLPYVKGNSDFSYMWEAEVP